MIRWNRLGLTFDVSKYRSSSFRISHAQAVASLDQGTHLRLYYSTRPEPDESGAFVSYTSFVDVLPTDPTVVIASSDEPVMELGGRGTFDEHGIYPFSPVVFQDRLIAFYGGWSRPVSVPFDVSIGIAESFDGGVSFERLGPGPVLAPNMDEPFIISGPKVRMFDSTLFLFYIAGSRWVGDPSEREPVYRIRVATSDDGLRWNRLGKDLIPCLDGDEVQASPDVLFSKGKYRMFFCYRNSVNYRGSSGSYRMGYAESSDLINWVRKEHAPVLTPGPEGAWDSEMIAYPHYFETGGSAYVAYLGNGFGREGFGLAKVEFE